MPRAPLDVSSNALALEVLERGRQLFHAAVLTDPAAFDLGTALISGIAAQQTANEPGGDRWVRLVDEAVDMYLDHVFKTTRSGRAE